MVQNEAWRLICTSSGVSNAPSSFTDGYKAMKQARPSGNRSWLLGIPAPVRDIALRYWTEYGQTLAAYRDVDQHFDVVQTGCLLRLEAGRIISIAIVLPDNPEAKSSSRYTYEPGVSAVEFARSAFEHLHALVEALAEHHRAVPAALQQPNVMRPRLDVAAVQNGGVAAVLVTDYDGRAAVVVEKQASGQLSFRRVVH
jgi:hypothetical protein